MIRCVAKAALASRARPVVAVLGSEAAQVKSALIGLDVATVLNSRHDDGLSTSLRKGLEAVPPGAEAAVVLLADMPTVETSLLDALIDAFEAAPRALAVVPVKDGRRGNPVLLSRRLFDSVFQLSGDQGAGRLLAGLQPAEGIAIQWPNPSIFEDADTLAALEALSANPLTKGQPQTRK
jgi:molybdenum cofactor cytidylyltransferase